MSTSRQPQILGKDRYELTARLGEGGMAGVYRAWDTRLKVERAIKVMLPQAARSKKLRLRFEREAQTLARLEHPHLVRVYDVATHAGVPFLVMELVTGGTLNDWVERNGPMPPRMAVGAILHLCEGVVTAHEADIVHRDIKPHNVLVNQAGVCKLADFGIAHVAEDGLTRTGSTMGTMGYMPPEQRKDAKSVDPRCDLFSIAATLWFLLKAEPVVDLFLIGDDPQLLDGIPDALHPVLRKALSYDRADRQPDVLTLQEELAETVELLPADRPCPELAAPEPTVPELEADWFSELAPLFDEDFRATPEPADLRAPVGKALPYYMPSAPPTANPPQRRTSVPKGGRETDSLPDYIDREALSKEGRHVDILGAPDPTPEPEPDTSSIAKPMLVGGGQLAVLGAGVPALFLLVAFLFTAVGLERTSGAVEQTETAYFELLDQESGLINDMVVLGAPRASLDERYFAYQDAKEPGAREAAADALVEALEQASHTVDGSPRAKTIRAQVERLVRARDAHRDAEASWEGHASTLRGWILRGVGIGNR